MATYTEQLAEVQAAISRILTSSQEFEISGGAISRRARRADLAALEAREKRLITLAAQENRGRPGRRVRQIAVG